VGALGGGLNLRIFINGASGATSSASHLCHQACHIHAASTSSARFDNLKFIKK